MTDKAIPPIAIMVVVLLLATMFVWAIGIVKAFRSHWVTGVIVLLVEPAPVIVGICEIFGYPLADKITALHQ